MAEIVESIKSKLSKLFLEFQPTLMEDESVSFSSDLKSLKNENLKLA